MAVCHLENMQHFERRKKPVSHLIHPFGTGCKLGEMQVGRAKKKMPRSHLKTLSTFGGRGVCRHGNRSGCLSRAILKNSAPVKAEAIFLLVPGHTES